MIRRIACSKRQLRCQRLSRLCGTMQRHAASPSQANAPFLSSSQIQEFDEKGFLVLPDFVTEQELDALKARANAIVDDFDPAEVAIFSTTKQEKLTSDYFLKSANNISCFFEEGAFDEQGELIKPKGLSINKIGHALHDLDPVFRNVSRSDAIKQLYKSLGFEKPLPVQSMYIFKQPSIGGPVVPHQDRMVLDDSKTGVTWGSGKPDFSDLTLEPLEVKAGTVIVLHGSNVHGSNANTSDISRHAYSMHVVEGDGATWLPDNWLQRNQQLPFEPLY